MVPMYHPIEKPIVSMTEGEFEEAFEACSLPKGSFHHQDHVRLAWIYLQKYPLTEAIDRYVAGIKRFATANGAPDLYHETITWTYLLLTHERLHRIGKQHTWDDFSRSNADLLDWGDSVLKSYYSDATLKSDLARKIFVLPDQQLPS